jgi:hypothetical protein
LIGCNPIKSHPGTLAPTNRSLPHNTGSKGIIGY